MVVVILHLGLFAVQGALVDEDMRAVLQLAKEKKAPAHAVQELKQAMQMLQMRERQFQEMVQVLKGCSSAKVNINPERLLLHG